MSGKAHSLKSQNNNWSVRAAWSELRWLAPILIILFAFVFASARYGAGVLDRLATGDPNPERRARMDGLRAARGLMLPPAEGGRLIWQARGSDGEAGLFLAGAAFSEVNGCGANAVRAWLALEALSRGKKEQSWESLSQAQELQQSLTIPIR